MAQFQSHFPEYVCHLFDILKWQLCQGQAWLAESSSLRIGQWSILFASFRTLPISLVLVDKHNSLSLRCLKEDCSEPVPKWRRLSHVAFQASGRRIAKYISLSSITLPVLLSLGRLRRIAYQERISCVWLISCSEILIRTKLQQHLSQHHVPCSQTLSTKVKHFAMKTSSQAVMAAYLLYRSKACPDRLVTWLPTCGKVSAVRNLVFSQAFSRKDLPLPVKLLQLENPLLSLGTKRHTFLHSCRGSYLHSIAKIPSPLVAKCQLSAAL